MLIGLNGRIGAGKNTVAQRLAMLHGNVIEVSFAAKLKESVCALLGCTLHDLEVWKNKPERCVAVGTLVDGLGFVPHKDTVMTVRELLQRYGTEAHRDVFGEDFWLDAALPLHDWFYRDDILYVVTDMRFPNEAARVQGLGGVTVQVIGPDEHSGDHRSEIPLVCDYGLNNARRDDGFAALDRNLRQLLGAISVPLAA